MRKLTHEEFIERAIGVHGDKYDYSEAVYVLGSLKMKIKCNKSGHIFEQKGTEHLKGVGCKKCSMDDLLLKSKKTTKQFIEEAISVHGDRYDYSLVNYTTNKNPVTIICKIHGETTVGAITHLKGANCYKCGKEGMASKCRTTKEGFIEKAVKVHGYKYDYSDVKYINNGTFITIKCPIHGKYKKTPDKHTSGSGCMKCLLEARTKTTEEFIIESNKVHNNLYTYDNTIYVSSNKKLIVTCKIHGDFLQGAGAHRSGNGCLKCAKETTVFKRSHYIKLAEKSNLYLILVYNEHEKFYKIGKTINELKTRFAGSSLPYSYDVINIINDDIGFIYDLEIKLHRKYKEYKYKPSIDFPGKTECYSLNLPIQEIINL